MVFDQLGEPHDFRKALTVLLHQGIGVAQKQSSTDHSDGYRRVRDALPKEKRYGIRLQQRRDAHWMQGPSDSSKAGIGCGELGQHRVAYTPTHVCISLNNERCTCASGTIVAWPLINLDHDEVLACRTICPSCCNRHVESKNLHKNGFWALDGHPMVWRAGGKHRKTFVVSGKIEILSAERKGFEPKK